jgi:DNA polymerase-4
MREKLNRDGIRSIGQLQQMNRNELLRYGSMGNRLYYLSRGEDMRHVSPEEESKSIGAETTFFTDISEVTELEAILWPLCEKVARRAKRQQLQAHTVTLKLKTADFKSRTRSVSLSDATQLAHRMFDAIRPLLLREATGTKFRLIGVSLSNIEDENHAELNTLDVREAASTKAELAMDKIRDKFGLDAVERGLGTRAKEK